MYIHHTWYTCWFGTIFGLTHGAISGCAPILYGLMVYQRKMSRRVWFRRGSVWLSPGTAGLKWMLCGSSVNSVSPLSHFPMLFAHWIGLSILYCVLLWTRGVRGRGHALTLGGTQPHRTALRCWHAGPPPLGTHACKLKLHPGSWEIFLGDRLSIPSRGTSIWGPNENQRPRNKIIKVRRPGRCLHGDLRTALPSHTGPTPAR